MYLGLLKASEPSWAEYVKMWKREQLTFLTLSLQKYEYEFPNSIYFF